MSDVKDILGVAQKAGGGAQAEASGSKAKPSEKKADRPKWMSREAFALLDNSHPIAPSALGAAKNGCPPTVPLSPPGAPRFISLAPVSA